jgi:hypothetical protein
VRLPLSSSPTPLSLYAPLLKYCQVNVKFWVT